MSVQASIDIKLSKYNQNNQSPIELIKVLLSSGWTLNDHGGISYLPVGDNGDYDWILSEKISQNELMKILEEKEKTKELIAVVLTWKDTNIGGSFHFYNPEEISMILNVNRQILYGPNNFKTTNFNWYLSRLIPVFYDNKIALKSFTLDEIK